MCFPPEAAPPPVPESLLVSSTPPQAQDVVLTSGDGTQFLTTYALTPESRGPAVLILPDVRGLFAYYRNLARLVAAAGHHAIVIDYFGRSAGAEQRSDGFEYMPHIKQTTPEQVQLDLIAARDHLAEVSGANSFVTMGFCFGGSQSYLATTNADLGLTAAISFYGGLNAARMGVFPHPAGEAHRMNGRLLAIYGGADPSIPDGLRDEFDAALTKASVAHEFVVYPGAPHSFFDRNVTDYETECQDAWQRVLEFLKV